MTLKHGAVAEDEAVVEAEAERAGAVVEEEATVNKEIELVGAAVRWHVRLLDYNP